MLFLIIIELKHDLNKLTSTDDRRCGQTAHWEAGVSRPRAQIDKTEDSQVLYWELTEAEHKRPLGRILALLQDINKERGLRAHLEYHSYEETGLEKGSDCPRSPESERAELWQQMQLFPGHHTAWCEDTASSPRAVALRLGVRKNRPESLLEIQILRTHPSVILI